MRHALMARLQKCFEVLPVVVAEVQERRLYGRSRRVYKHRHRTAPPAHVPGNRVGHRALALVDVPRALFTE